MIWDEGVADFIVPEPIPEEPLTEEDTTTPPDTAV
jgi:hypothetical protein